LNLYIHYKTLIYIGFFFLSAIYIGLQQLHCHHKQKQTLILDDVNLQR